MKSRGCKTANMPQSQHLELMSAPWKTEGATELEQDGKQKTKKMEWHLVKEDQLDCTYKSQKKIYY